MTEKKKDFQTTREGLVRIKHSNGSVGTCLPVSLPALEARGWSAVAPDYKAPASAEAKKTGSDPADKK